VTFARNGPFLEFYKVDPEFLEYKFVGRRVLIKNLLKMSGGIESGCFASPV
jgi:hypothetical protein